MALAEFPSLTSGNPYSTIRATILGTRLVVHVCVAYGVPTYTTGRRPAYSATNSPGYALWRTCQYEGEGGSQRSLTEKVEVRT